MQVQEPITGTAPLSEKHFDGLVITSHSVRDAKSKERATTTLINWQHQSNTAVDWIRHLESGHTIQPSQFTPKPEGKYTHALEFWQHTHFVFCDADNIKGVEFLSDGTDKNPEGIAPFTSGTGLSELYPTLKEKAFAIGQSVSSMSEDKPPAHRRYRLVFLFDEPITTEEKYHAILLSLADEFSIIPPAERSPAQPIFGSERDGYNKFAIIENVLSVSDYPDTPPPKAVPTAKAVSTAPTLDTDTKLNEFLDKHSISYTPCSKESEKYFVECPYKEHHTDGICKEKDAYVFTNTDSKFAFNCSHTSCKAAGRTTWQAFKDAHGIRSNGYKAKSDKQADEQPDKPSDLSLPEDRFFQKARGFNVRQMITELTATDDYISYGDDVCRYKNGVYRQDERFNQRVRELLNTRASVSRVNETRAAFQDGFKTDLSDSRHLINFQNGLLDLNTLDLIPHTPEHKTVTQFPVEWKPLEYTATNCDKSKTCQLLTELVNDNSLFTIMEAIGSIYHNDSPQMQTGFILTGAGSNGKSTLLKIVEMMIGKENICNTDWGDFETKPYSAHSLVGKSLTLNEDFTNSSKLGGVVKHAVTGGTINARQIYERAFDFIPQATWIMACNDLPHSSDTSYGFYRRWFIISFPNCFEKNQNKGNQVIRDCTEKNEQQDFYCSMYPSLPEKHGSVDVLHRTDLSPRKYGNV